MNPMYESEPAIDPRDRSLATILHLSSLSGYIIPLGNFLVPLVIWLIKKDESRDINAIGREVLNFNLSMLIWAVVSLVLCLLLIGFVLLMGLWLFGIVVTIIAAVRASEGRRYRYPLTMRFL